MIKELLINTNVLKRLALLEQKQCLAHAYLFVGSVGVGKSETALEAAKWVNCEEKGMESCGKCSTCIQIDAGHHPDVLRVEAEESKTIKIEQIRALLERIQLRAFSARKKVYIIKNVEDLTSEASNSLLKTLEEPTKDSLLLLTTSVPEKVLETVRSRCHSIFFAPTPTAELKACLSNKYGLVEDDSQFLAYFSEGSLARARNLSENSIIQHKNDIINTFVLSNPTDEDMKDVLSDKGLTKEFLQILLSWVRDALLICAGGATDSLMHADRLKQLELFIKKYNFEELLDLQKEIVNTCKLLAENLNVKIPLLIIKEKLHYG